MTIRIRGIYATALTALFDDVVQASPAIRDRFDESFPVAPADLTVRTTNDRQGVTLAGEPTAVADARERLADLSRDTLAWSDPLPEDGVFVGEVTETLGDGSVVAIGDGREGYLPDGETDDPVDTGDTVRVQVRRPKPPWSDRRTRLSTRIEVSGELVQLVPGESRTTGAANLEDLLPPEIPDGWRPRWGRDEEDASMDALGAALADATDRAETIDGLPERGAPDPPTALATPLATSHVWFGREGRFELDELRRDVTRTIPGHHRVKAGASGASAAVDFAEALGAFDADATFPFETVTRQFGPQTGETLAIEHGKPAGQCLTLGRGEVTAVESDGSLTLEREMSPGGTYDALDVERRAGDVAVTKFEEGRWWYPTVYRGEDGGRRGTYVNVCTPVELFPDAARYVDLHVDVVKGPDGAVRRVDDDELDASVAAGHVSESLAAKARAVASKLERALSG
ncbi:RNA-binding protein [Halobacteriales archaeon SW_8_65_20]|nr:MAG: RNA-binding protein [Halobacteriales archaeon SW_8_65_20]